MDFSVELALIDAGLQSAGAAMVLDAVPVPPQPINVIYVFSRCFFATFFTLLNFFV